MEEKSFPVFIKQSLANFFEAVLNLFLFFPYYFSVISLSKTLFSPWKNLVQKKTTVGFSFEEWLGRMGFNLISRGMGFIMRLFILVSFLVLESTYVLSLPVIFILFFILLPLSYLKFLLSKTEEEEKTELRESFVKVHHLKSENINKAQEWFEKYYQLFHKDSHWWRKKHLFSIPPLARDWAAGFTPTLGQFCQELTTASYQDKIKGAIDRQREMSEIETILSKNQGANAIIVGDEGVGKHTIVDTLAKKIYDGTVNPLLVYKRILKIDFEIILASTTDQKKREALVEALFAEAAEAGNIILMIENLERYVADQDQGVNLTVPIEKFGRSSAIHFLCTSTPFAYQKYILRNPQMGKLFTKVDIIETDKALAEDILLDKALYFERANKVIIPYETVKNAIEKSDFFITNIPFPEKAIEILDSAVALSKQTNPNLSQAIMVDPAVIDTVIAQTAHVPTTLTVDLKQKLSNLESDLGQYIVMQDIAIKSIASSLRRSYLLLGKRKKPLANLLFLGPTGVGKTETAKALAKIFFGDEKKLLRFDMSLYQSKLDVGNLIGSQDLQNTGLLTQAVRENPYGVLLLDEIEKAHKDLLNLFLTVLDEGYFTDGFGKKVDCKNLIIIATSNAGADYIFKQITENPEDDFSSSLVNYLIEQKYFAPEFLNRFDSVIAYQPLDAKAVLELGRRIVDRISDNYMKSYKVKVEIADDTLHQIIEKGYHREFGARDLDRVITQELEDKIAKQILDGKVGEGQTLTL